MHDVIEKPTAVVIAEPNIVSAVFNIIGTAPYVQHKFSQKSRLKIADQHRAGSQARGKKVREARDFSEDCRQATHIAKDGWYGIPAPAFRNAMISACRLVGFQMTKAKLSVFIVADGFDVDDGTPLVRLVGGEPEENMAYARNESGVVDLRCRPMWEGWGAGVTVKWDRGQFSETDIANLLARAGVQVGIGEGRPDSPNSNGVGWGTFSLAN